MTAESIGVASSTPDGESLRTAYEQVCECHKDLTEFRAKLLALLPLASSAGIFVLLDGDAKWQYIPIGLIGVLFTAGLYMFENRGEKICGAMATAGEAMEHELHLSTARFNSVPDPAWKGFLGVTWAGRVVYASICLAWFVVVALGADAA